jgi:uncharacterized membrane protein
MPVFAITGFDVSLFLHIAAVVVGFGATFAFAVLNVTATQMGPRYLPLVHRTQLKINRMLANPALVLIIVTGLYQTHEHHWKLGSFWISATFAIAIVLGGLLGGFFIPADKRLGALVEAEIAAAGDGPVVLSEEYQRGLRSEAIAGTITGVLVLIAVFLMVVKPGA